MPKKNTRAAHIHDAAYALKDLNMYHTIIQLCENSLICSSRENTTQRIIKLAQLEAAHCLRDYDRAVAAAEK